MTSQYDPINPTVGSKFFLLYQKLEHMGVIFPKKLSISVKEGTDLFSIQDSQQANSKMGKNHPILNQSSIN